MRTILSLAALLTTTLAAPTPTPADCPNVGSQAFFPFAFTAFNDVTGKQASASFYLDAHNREFRYQFANSALDDNGVIKATRLQSLTYFEYDNYACTVYDPDNSANGEVGKFDKALGWGDLVINGGQETDVTSFLIRCDSMVIWYPPQAPPSPRATKTKRVKGYLQLAVTLHNDVTGAYATSTIDTSAHAFFFGSSIFRNTPLEKDGKLLATSIQMSFPNGPLPVGYSCVVGTAGWQDPRTVGYLDSAHTWLDLDGEAGKAVETDVGEWVVKCDIYVQE